MKLIVGLGNPGKNYEKTRHNVGFMVLDHYLNGEKYEKKFNGEYIEKNINGEKVIFLKPLSYMNLSGDVVVKFKNYYKIELKESKHCQAVNPSLFFKFSFAPFLSKISAIVKY